MRFKEIELRNCTCIICNNKSFYNTIEKSFTMCNNCYDEITNIEIDDLKYEIYMKKIKKFLLDKYAI